MPDAASAMRTALEQITAKAKADGTTALVAAKALAAETNSFHVTAWVRHWQQTASTVEVDPLAL